MATRVNTKFVLALCGVLILLVGGVVAVWYVIESRSADRYIRMAEQSVADGDLSKAVSFYGRAVYRRPNDLDLLDRYAELATQAQVRNLATAQRYLRDYTGAKRQAAERSGYTDERVEDFYATMYEFGRRFRSPGYFDQIIEQANNRLASDPENVIAQKYRGMATVRRLTRDSPLDVRDRALEDLSSAAERLPDDTDVAWALSLWKLREAERIDQPGDNIGDRPEEADQLRQEALDLATAMLSADPADPIRQLRYLELMTNSALNPDQLTPHPNAAPIRGVVDAAVAQAGVTAELDAVGLGGLLTLLTQLYVEPIDGEGSRMTEGVAMASATLAAANEQYPDNLGLTFFEAELNRTLGRTQEALEGYDRVIEGADETDFIGFLDGRQFAPLAYRSKGELILAGIDPTDQAATAEALDRVDTIADELAALVGDESPLVDILRGKSLLIRGEVAKSIAYLDRASGRLGDANPELLLLSARARTQSGQPGAAAERYRRLLEIRPEAHAVRLDYARLLTALDEPELARAQLAIVLEVDPDNQQAAQLMTAAMLRSDDASADAAIARLERAAESGGLDALTRLAAAYTQVGATEQAADAADRALAIDPAHLPALQIAMNATQDLQTRRALVQAAADAGLPEERVAMLTSLLDLAESGDESARRNLIELMIANNEDPVRSGLAEARLYIDSEDEAEAQRGRDALDELIASHGDHPSVIEYRFARALQAEDFELADQLVEQAEATDADLAEGQFFRARLLEAEGQTERAILTMVNALETRPIFSEGWTRLGRLYRAAGQTDEAVDALQRAVDQSPGNLAALLVLTQLSVELGRFDQALDAARNAARRAPRSREVQLLAISLEQQHGDLDLAIERRTAWAERFPEDRDNLRQLALAYAKGGDVDAAIDALDRSIQDDEDPLNTVRARATIYSLAGDPEKGLDVLRGYISARGDQVTTEDLTALAQFFVQNERRDLALRALAEARQREDPETMPASRAMGDLLFGGGRNEPAAMVYADVLAASPEDETVRLRLAETYLRLNRLDDARATLDDPTVADSSTAKLVQALIAREDGDLATALRLINQLIAAEPERADLYTHRGSILALQDGRMQTAINDVERSLSLEPDSTMARLTLARLLSNSGDASGAIDELERLVARLPDFRQGHATLADALVAAGRARDAELVLGNAAARFDDDPTWPRRLGQIAASQGETDDAVEAYRQALTLSRNANDFVSLTDALLRAGRNAEALSGIEAMGPQVGGAPTVRVLRGVALNRLGRSDEAIEAFQQSIADAQSLSALTNVAGRVSSELPPAEVASILDAASNDEREAITQIVAAGVLTSDDPASAMDRLRRVEAQAAGDPTIEPTWHRTAAIVAYSLDDYATASAMYERVLEASPNDASSLNNYAFMLISDLDQPQRGLEFAERAARLMPQNGRVLDTLGLAELYAGRVEDAVLTLQRSRQLEPLGINALHLGMAYVETGRLADARTMFEEAIRLGEATQDTETASRARELMTSLVDPSATVESP